MDESTVDPASSDGAADAVPNGGGASGRDGAGAAGSTAGRPGFRVRPVIRPRPDRDAGRTISRDETDEGWGDAPAGRDDDWYRRERPPHHGD